MADIFSIEVKTLALREPFRIAHGASSSRQVVRVRMGEAVGEAPFVPYDGGSPDETVEWLEQWAGGRDGRGDAWSRAVPADGRGFSWDVFSAGLPAEAPRVARLALSACLADAIGRAASVPFGRRLGLDPARAPAGCRSIGIPSDLAAYRDQVRAIARQFGVIKLKLGSGDPSFDLAVVAAAREAAPEAELMVDANCGWSAIEAARLIPQLTAWGIGSVEQPVGRRSLDEWRELRARLPRCPLPLVADESAQTAADVPLLVGLADGVNVKLVKAGGLDRAHQMIVAARRAGLSVMLGCMIESSLGVTAAAHLAPLADRIDLDGHLYLADDDWTGLAYDCAGRLVMPDLPGLGCRPVL